MNITRSFIRSTLTLASIAVATACGPLRMGSSPSASIIFANESIDQADVYATGQDGVPIRIGTVLGGQTSTLSLPATVLGQGGNINIAARLLAQSRTPSTGGLSIHAGDQLKVRLPSDERTLVVLPE